MPSVNFLYILKKKKSIVPPTHPSRLLLVLQETHSKSGRLFGATDDENNEKQKQKPTLKILSDNGVSGKNLLEEAEVFTPKLKTVYLNEYILVSENLVL